MPQPYAFINDRQQTSTELKARLDLSRPAAEKFDFLNSHIRNVVVLPGQLVIVGDHTTATCTPQEARLMQSAWGIRHSVMAEGGAGFALQNYDLLQSLLGYTSLGIGTAGDARSARDMVREEDIDLALVDIHLSDGPTGINLGRELGQDMHRTVMIGDTTFDIAEATTVRILGLDHRGGSLQRVMARHARRLGCQPACIQQRTVFQLPILGSRLLSSAHGFQRGKFKPRGSVLRVEEPIAGHAELHLHVAFFNDIAQLALDQCRILPQKCTELGDCLDVLFAQSSWAVIERQWQLDRRCR